MQRNPGSTPSKAAVGEQAGPPQRPDIARTMPAQARPCPGRARQKGRHRRSTPAASPMQPAAPSEKFCRPKGRGSRMVGTQGTYWPGPSPTTTQPGRQCRQNDSPSDRPAAHSLNRAMKVVTPSHEGSCRFRCFRPRAPLGASVGGRQRHPMSGGAASGRYTGRVWGRGVWIARNLMRKRARVAALLPFHF
jgi:hypothetical protein